MFQTSAFEIQIKSGQWTRNVCCLRLEDEEGGGGEEGLQEKLAKLRRCVVQVYLAKYP